MRQTTNDLLFQLEECRKAINECDLVRSKLSVDSAAMLRLRDLAVARLPVRLVLYWGIWRRIAVDASERTFLDRLAVLTRAIERTLALPCELCIVATDTHARLNGVPEDAIERYIASVSVAAADRAARVERLSTLMADAPVINLGKSPDDFVPPQKWQRLRAMLTSQAGKLFVDADDRAAAYELANLREGGAMLRAYPFGVFLHAGIPEIRPLLCSIPTLYIYTGPGQKTRKPWFESEDNVTCAPTGD